MTDNNASTSVLPDLTKDTLESHTWRLSDAKLADGSRYDALLDTSREPLELVFKDGHVMINGSCNQLGADYKVENQAVTFGFWMSTRIACAGELGKLDALATGAVTGKYSVFAKAGTLGLMIENDTSTAEFMAVAGK